MNYKINRILKYGLLIMHSSFDFISEYLSIYIKTYINSFYYHVFDTVYSSIYNDKVMNEELEGKRLEMLDVLSNYELIDSNDVFNNKKNCINELIKIMPFLIKLDKINYTSKSDVSSKIEKLLDDDIYVKERLGSDVSKLVNLVVETNKTLDNFFERKDTYFSLDYLLFKDHDNYVEVVINNDVKMLLDNYKKSLVERCYKDKKIQDDKFLLLSMKFIKQLLFDIYMNSLLYERYFITIPEEVFTDKKVLSNILDLYNNPLIKRYITLCIHSDNFYSNQALIKKYVFSIACCQDFSHINDVNSKLSNMDNSNLFDFVIVLAFKDKDYNDFLKYSMVNLEDILFNREV